MGGKGTMRGVEMGSEVSVIAAAAAAAEDLSDDGDIADVDADNTTGLMVVIVVGVLSDRFESERAGEVWGGLGVAASSARHIKCAFAIL